MQRMLSYLRRTIDNYNMIEEGDKIAVGLSGGKDSFTLLMGLKALQRFYPKKFDFATKKWFLAQICLQKCVTLHHVYIPHNGKYTQTKLSKVRLTPF